MKPAPAWAAVLALAAFLLIAVGIWYLPQAQSFDTGLFRSINDATLGSSFDSLMSFMSLYGREYFWIGTTLVMLVVGDKRTRALAIGLAALFIVGIVAGELAKELLFRTRPDVALSSVNLRVPLETDSSFPSGHALIVSIGAVYSLLTFRKKWVSGLLALEAAVVSFSRVYVGVHYPLDVLGGVLLGSFIALAGLSLGLKFGKQWVERLAELASKVLKEGPLKL